MIKKGQFDVFFIQETELQLIDDDLVREFSGRLRKMLVELGGSLIMWKLGAFFSNMSFVGEGFIGIYVVWKETIMYLVNVYSSCHFNSKHLL